MNKCWRFFRSPRIPIEERVHVCPRGVDAGHFSSDRKSNEHRAEMILKAGIPSDAAVLLYAGRISPEKNVGLLVEFMKILAADESRDYRLLVAGDGPQAEWLKAQAGEHMPGRIVLLGHLDKETLANYYSNADVFVHPNPKEPFGIAPLEAMASGVATVVPNAGGLLFYATDENTWLVEPTAEAFASAIREAFENEQMREEKISKAFEAVAANTRIRSTDFLFETYDKLFEDFQKRRDLFTDVEAAKSFDFRTFSD